MKAGRFVASCQPNFLGGWTGAGNLRGKAGPVRTKRAISLRAILRQGIPLAFGSDGMPYGPLNGIHRAVNASSPELSMSVEEAVRAYTAGGAYAGFEEDVKGILAPGKLADCVILQDDPFDEPARIRDRRIHSTWVGGGVVYRVDERHEAQ
jgi:predicted amidohydrolase YtcJ